MPGSQEWEHTDVWGALSAQCQGLVVLPAEHQLDGRPGTDQGDADLLGQQT